MADTKPLQFINSFYFKPIFNRNEKGKSVKVSNDAILLIYRNEEKNKKGYKLIDSPQIQFYAGDPEEFNEPANFAKIDKLKKVKVPYQDLGLQLAKLDKSEDSYWNLLRQQGKYSTDRLYHSNIPYIFGSDIDIQDYYKARFLETYTAKANKITKSFYDIEVDSISIEGFPEPEEALCPVNMITYMSIDNRESYTYLLRSGGDKHQISELENKKLNKLIKEAEEKINDTLSYCIEFFDDELELIEAFFSRVHIDEPDFCCAWNQSFDAVTLINRILRLGGTPIDIICDPDVPDGFKEVYFTKDTKHFQHHEKNDNFHVVGKTVYVDLLLIYAQIRASMSKKESYSLNNVAKIELGDEKLDYGEADNIKTLFYDDYYRGVLYNIKDVDLLLRLEEKTGDLSLIFSLAEMTQTRLSKTMRKTVSVANFARKIYKDFGYAMSNNRNASSYGSNEAVEKFEGAIVADPVLNGPYGIDLGDGKNSKSVFQNVIDFDLASLYPSIIRQFNIEGSAQHGRLNIEGLEITKEHDPNLEFNDDIISNNTLLTATKWFNAPTLEEMNNILHENLGEEE